MVSNELEAADDLAHGEETEHLGEQDAAADDLRSRNVPGALGDRRRVSGRGLGGGRLQQGAGVFDGAEGAVEVALERGDGTAEGTVELAHRSYA